MIVFVVIASVLNQFCGINAVGICCTQILEGVPNLNISVGNDLIQTTALIGTLVGPIFNRYLTIKQLWLIGELGMTIELGLVSVFQTVHLPYFLLASIMMFTVTY